MQHNVPNDKSRGRVGAGGEGKGKFCPWCLNPLLKQGKSPPMQSPPREGRGISGWCSERRPLEGNFY